MSETPMITVIAYDIARAPTRRRVASILEDQAVRVQKSIFEAKLTKKAAQNLFDMLTIRLDEGDSLRMYAMSQTGLERSLTHGGAPILENADYWLL